MTVSRRRTRGQPKDPFWRRFRLHCHQHHTLCHVRRRAAETRKQAVRCTSQDKTRGQWPAGLVFVVPHAALIGRPVCPLYPRWFLHHARERPSTSRPRR
ncbi:hypothetical protein DAEQUDRAFT_385597 [Daedalea quercina L-15889]|uniref:Uncharacterized protein n=1 Tax=Daedalea quercina L-15889 TaxID=1314783 RepID=A0A165P222_9APHY|nr:hypothetical protein DAEQUDRAFT_385597 [Daedalea quercina L-15889]